jgi:ATP-dependent DNA helicase RecQ
LALSWSRKPSRFLAEIRPRSASVRVVPEVRLPTSAANTGLLEALQLWRRDRAKQDAVPAYVVAHDAMLAIIAAERPSSLAALRRIKGMGPVKLDQYGHQILEIIARVR